MRSTLSLSRISSNKLRGIKKRRRATHRGEKLGAFLSNDSLDADPVPTRFIPKLVDGRGKGRSDQNAEAWRWTAGQISMIKKAVAFRKNRGEFGTTYSPLIGRSATTLGGKRIPVENSSTPAASSTDLAAENILDRVIETDTSPSALMFRGWIWLQDIITVAGWAPNLFLMDRWIADWNGMDRRVVLSKGDVRRWLNRVIDEEPEGEDYEYSSIDSDSDYRSPVEDGQIAEPLSEGGSSGGASETDPDCDLVEDDEKDPTYVEETPPSPEDASQSDFAFSESDGLETAALVDQFVGDMMDNACTDQSFEEPDSPRNLPRDHVAELLDESTREATFDELETPAPQSSTPVLWSSLLRPSAADETERRDATQGERIDDLKKGQDKLGAIVDGLKKNVRDYQSEMTKTLKDAADGFKKLRDMVDTLNGLHDEYRVDVRDRMRAMLEDTSRDSILHKSVLEVMGGVMQEGLSRQDARTKLGERS